MFSLLNGKLVRLNKNVYLYRNSFSTYLKYKSERKKKNNKWKRINKTNKK